MQPRRDRNIIVKLHPLLLVDLKDARQIVAEINVVIAKAKGVVVPPGDDASAADADAKKLLDRVGLTVGRAVPGKMPNPCDGSPSSTKRYWSKL